MTVGRGQYPDWHLQARSVSLGIFLRGTVTVLTMPRAQNLLWGLSPASTLSCAEFHIFSLACRCLLPQLNEGEKRVSTTDSASRGFPRRERREGGEEGWRKGVKKRGIEEVEDGERRGKNGEGRRILLQVK